VDVAGVELAVSMASGVEGLHSLEQIGGEHPRLRGRGRCHLEEATERDPAIHFGNHPDRPVVPYRAKHGHRREAPEGRERWRPSEEI
jgi:hypothetical protein